MTPVQRPPSPHMTQLRPQLRPEHMSPVLQRPPMRPELTPVLQRPPSPLIPGHRLPEHMLRENMDLPHPSRLKNYPELLKKVQKLSPRIGRLANKEHFEDTDTEYYNRIKEFLPKRMINAVSSVEDECPIAPPSKPLRYCRPAPFHSTSGEKYFYVGEAYGAPVAE
jgi:hypothetical protein